jgi:biopolymer transport protein ExbB/TolQ
MRMRTIFLIIGIVLVAAFAALNVDEFTRPSVLSLGFTTVQVPLGMLMLLLLVIAIVIFLASTLYIQSTNLIETRRYARELNTQRELADKAEASRFTELRQYIEAQSSATLNREAANATVLAERLAQTQAALMHRLEQSDNTTAAYMGQLEDRMERRTGAYDGSAAARPML